MLILGYIMGLKQIYPTLILHSKATHNGCPEELMNLNCSILDVEKHLGAGI